MFGQQLDNPTNADLHLLPADDPVPQGSAPISEPLSGPAVRAILASAADFAPRPVKIEGAVTMKESGE